MDKVYESADLSIILQKVLEELSDTSEEKNALVTTTELPVLSVIPFHI